MRQKYYCKECNKEISYGAVHYGSGLCKSCSHKGERNAMFGKKGKLHPNWKNIDSKHICKNCGKKISDTSYYGKKNCQSCWLKIHNQNLKGNHHTEETKKHLSLVHGGTGIPYERREYPAKFYELREQIRKRDNYTCQLCHKVGKHVHHINYNKKDNRKQNLITLCFKCNMKVNYNRINWIKYFKKLLK
jgi:hypothetical protein